MNITILKMELPARLSRISWWFLKMLIGVAFGLGLLQIDSSYLESYLYDLRVRLSAPAPVSGKIELIRVDNKSVDAFKGVPHAGHYAEALRTLEVDRPRYLIFVNDLQKVPGTLEQKKALALVLSKLPNVIQATSTPLPRWQNQDVSLSPPFEMVKAVPAPKTSDRNVLAQDGVTRRMLLTYQENPLLHLQIAQDILNHDDETPLNSKDFSGHYAVADSEQVLINFRPKNFFPSFAFDDLYRHAIPDNTFRDKVVFIGEDLGISFDDYVMTPFSRDTLAMTRLELQANMLETVLQNNAPNQASEWAGRFLTILICILMVHLVLSIRPLNGLMILILSVLAFSLIGFVAFAAFRYAIPMSHPYLSVFICYYFLIPYRLIIENRKSWELSQKNLLLSEVELLKTNFIGMMSHDLKTPLARIQGMAEVIATNPTGLGPAQTEAMETIKKSVHDLVQFISAILNYAKIESRGVQLHLQTKDINELLKEVIAKNEFLAKSKKIQLVAELEPLFSIPLDPELMKQVFSNLVENAIKYSPESSKILVSSEDQDGKVVIQIADQGQGIPQDEVANVFQKFFRSSAAKSSPVKGSGLGLYLAKYFVELHGGQISCESEIGVGSTFTVELPVS